MGIKLLGLLAEVRPARSAQPLAAVSSDKQTGAFISPDRKVAVVNGASNGIGVALVKAYLDCGYLVVATALSFEASVDDDVVFVPGDIADRKIAQRSISEGVARFGRIDTLINNAGILISKPFTDYTKADYAAIVGVNLTASSTSLNAP